MDFNPPYTNVGLIPRLNAHTAPNRTALITDDSEITWSELAAHVDEVANMLRSNGVNQGTRVALLFPNGLNAVTMLFAMGLTGGVAVPINPKSTKSEVAELVRHADAQLTLTENDSQQICAATGIEAQSEIAMHPLKKGFSNGKSERPPQFGRKDHTAHQWHHWQTERYCEHT